MASLLSEMDLLLLIFFSFQTDDGGQYRCTARNELGEVSLSMNLDITADISVGKNKKLVHLNIRTCHAAISLKMRSICSQFLPLIKKAALAFGGLALDVRLMVY